MFVSDVKGELIMKYIFLGSSATIVLILTNVLCIATAQADSQNGNAAPGAADRPTATEINEIVVTRHDPYEEERRSERLHGRVIRDLIRYWQAGRPSGYVRLEGPEIKVDASRWYCIMD